MSLFDATYSQDGSIEIRGKLTDGWRARQNTFGFVEQDQLDWRFDTRLRIQLEILARPSGRGPGYEEFPSTLQCNANYQGIRCWVNDGQCLLRVKFVGSDDSPNQELPWRLTTNNKLAVFWSYGFGALGILPSYDAQLLVVMNPPPTPHPRDIRDWSRRFWPGGLPSLGKRA
ncbi:MAG: hypothetical protein WBQ04_06815 [Candidatus Acidiferrales bacterium]